jgi:hypothetical protein
MAKKRMMRFGNQQVTVAGVLFTLCLATYLLWGAKGWLQRGEDPGTPSPAERRRNQVRTFENLQTISRAQAAYRRLSREKLGKTGHAVFVAHLWIGVDERGGRIPLDLIPRRLALAMGPSHAVDGYYFLDIHERFLPGADRARRIDYEREWALRAVPKDWQESGDIVFLADESGKIFARRFRRQPVRFPVRPEKDGWTPISTRAALRQLQPTTADSASGD